jgi:hypothetical protein
VSYIYFTRIIVFLLGSTLPWEQAYWSTVATQGGEQALAQQIPGRGPGTASEHERFAASTCSPLSSVLWLLADRICVMTAGPLLSCRLASSVRSDIPVLRRHGLQVPANVCQPVRPACYYRHRRRRQRRM